MMNHPSPPPVDGTTDAAVRAQRDLKRKGKALAKLEKEVGKGANPKKVAELEALRKEVAELEIVSAPALQAKMTTAAAASNKGLQPESNPGSSAPTGAATTATTASNAFDVPPPDRQKTKNRAIDAISPEELQADEAMLRQVIEQQTKVIPVNCALHPKQKFPEDVHYKVAELGMLMKSYRIVGGNARTFAVIEAFRVLLQTDYSLAKPNTTPYDALKNGLRERMNANYAYLKDCCHPTPGMRYLFHALSRRLAKLGAPTGFMYESPVTMPTMSLFDASLGNRFPSEPNAKPASLADENSSTAVEQAMRALNIIEEELQLSIVSIVKDRAKDHFSARDTIAVFGRSSTVELILLHAAVELQKRPRVIVIDAPPFFEGRSLAGRLQQAGMPVTYGLLTSCCVLLPQCTKVFIGASAVSRNGEVCSRCGTSIVAACAKQFRKPVLCFNEGYKFEDELWLDNFARSSQFNVEASLHETTGFVEHQFSSQYLYDLTPASYIDMIVCEMGTLHPSAIAGAIRLREERENAGETIQ